MRARDLLVCLPLWLGCGGSPTDTTLPEPEQGQEQERLTDFDPETLVRFELIADVENLEVGTQANLAALFHIAEGWHVYWINPGESGLPTKITVNQVAGLRVEPARFPGPARFDSNDEIINYGYHHTLLLPMQISSIDAGEPVQLVAEARWLACREDACVPGKGSASLRLLRGDAASLPSDHVELFQQNAALLPKPFAALSEFGTEAEILPEGDRSQITLRAGEGVQLAIFPIHDQAISDVTRIDAGIQFTLHAAGDKSELAVLSVTSDSVTHFFSITSELLLAAANTKGTL